jgi:ring-1,2-phenylacetyl-CoA epoxidase subunit PaaC
VKADIAPDLATIKAAFDATVDRVLAEATLKRPTDGYMMTGGRQGKHSEHLGYILADMQYLQRAYPGAQW